MELFAFEVSPISYPVSYNNESAKSTIIVPPTGSKHTFSSSIGTKLDVEIRLSLPPMDFPDL